MDDRSFTQNRELSWLRFNDRVLSEAMDETVPLLERLKFIAIFTSNLDEFFMIRVGSLFDLTHLKSNAVDSKSGMSAKQQLDAIYEAVRPQYAKRQEIYFALQKQLRLHGIAALQLQELTPADWKVVRQYFKNSVAPILSPQIVDPHHPFPHLINNVLHVGAWLQYKSRVVFAVIPMPAALPEVLFLPGGELRYVRTAEIVMENLEQIFTNYTVLERVIFCVTRNADINPNDEAFDFDSDDFRKKMQKALKQRKRLEPVRLELSAPISETFSAYLQEHLPVTKQQIFVTSMPLKLGHVFTLEGRLSAEKRSALTYPPFTPVTPGWAGATGSIQQQILRQDRLLSYPYESMAPFLRLVREAASDPAVLSIKITIYRLAQKAQLVEYLCEAAENGKDVTALIELRARFDEQNNIDW
ncbi:MAG: RNA degradosome polyphosphate kinase, partial [Clostridiales bacterium]|nr:RNA degradosome polyphosphate kinase [Clostridiales bacterium]